MSFTDPHPLTIIESYRYKDRVGKEASIRFLPQCNPNSFSCNTYRHVAVSDANKRLKGNPYLWLSPLDATLTRKEEYPTPAKRSFFPLSSQPEVALRSGLRWDGFGAGGGEMEADEPFAGNAVTAGFGRIELPAARGFHGEIGEIGTGACGIQGGFGDVAGGIDLYADADANDAMNGGEGSRRGVGQNLVEDFAARG